MALAPPAPGEWGLVGRDADLVRLHEHLGRHAQATVVPVAGTGDRGHRQVRPGPGLCGRLRGGLRADRLGGGGASRAHRLQYSPVPGPGPQPQRCGLPRDRGGGRRRALLGGAHSLVVFASATALHPFLPTGQASVVVTTLNEAFTANASLRFELEYLPAVVVAAWLGRELPGAGARAGRAGPAPGRAAPGRGPGPGLHRRLNTGATAASYLGLLATKDASARPWATPPLPAIPDRWPTPRTWPPMPWPPRPPGPWSCWATSGSSTPTPSPPTSSSG